MSIIDYLRQSLALTQAVIALVLSILIALIVSGYSLSMHLSDQRDEAFSLAQEILTAAEGGATNAAWTLDPALAKQIVDSITALGMVQDAVLIGETENILAADRKPVQKNKHLIAWITSNFTGNEILGERKLYVELNNVKRQVGVLSIKLNPTPLAQEFLTFAGSVIITGLLQAVIIALVLLWLSSWLLSSPLRRVTESISKIDPENPDPRTLASLTIHAKNEMGQLVNHIEQMLKGLINAQLQLRHLATRDPLTNILNRTLIADRLSQSIITASAAILK